MVKVYLNPANLTDKIYHLGSFSSHTDVMSNNIRNRSHDLHDPIMGTPLPGSLSPISPGDIDYLTGAIKKSLTFINARIAEIEKCKKTIENLSSNGVAIPHSQGDITFEVPDDSAGLETADKLQKWAQGATDANDLRSGKLTFRSGRSFDEVMESMKANKGDTTYANSFIDRAGPENLTKLGDKDPKNNREAPIVGEILATASGTWDKEKSKRNADLIVSSVDEKDEWERIPIFNQMIRDHGVNGAKFATDFLVSVGDAARTLPIKEIQNSRIPLQTEKTTRPLQLTDYFDISYDPLSGPLDAMGADEVAARRFLTPNNGSEEDIADVRGLMGRYPIGKNAWTDTWTKLSSVTAEAHGCDYFDETTGSPESHQASAIASAVVNTIGEELKSKGKSCQISDASRSNLSNTISKFPLAVDAVANGDTPANSIIVDDKGNRSSANLGSQVPLQDVAGQGEYWSKGVGWQPTFSVDGLSGAIQTISENSEDLRKVSESVATMDRVRMAYAAAHKDVVIQKGDEEGNNSGARTVTAVEEAIASNSNNSAFMFGASRARVENDKAQVDRNHQVLVDTIFAATSFIPGPGKGAKEIWKMAADYGKNRSAAVLKEATEDLVTGNEAAAKSESHYSKEQMKKVSQENTIIQLMGNGIINEDAAAAAQLRDSEGRITVPYSNGEFDKTKIGKSEREYLTNRFVRNGVGVSEPVYHGLSRIEDNYEKAYNRGHG